MCSYLHKIFILAKSGCYTGGWRIQSTGAAGPKTVAWGAHTVAARIEVMRRWLDPEFWCGIGPALSTLRWWWVNLKQWRRGIFLFFCFSRCHLPSVDQADEKYRTFVSADGKYETFIGLRPMKISLKPLKKLFCCPLTDGKFNVSCSGGPTGRVT
jgi:hypothetical protein